MEGSNWPTVSQRVARTSQERFLIFLEPQNEAERTLKRQENYSNWGLEIDNGTSRINANILDPSTLSQSIHSAESVQNQEKNYESLHVAEAGLFQKGKTPNVVQKNGTQKPLGDELRLTLRLRLVISMMTKQNPTHHPKRHLQ